MATKQAKLTTMQMVQDFLPVHYDWTANEKAHLGDIKEMGKIIKTRLEKAGCELEEMYGIKHNKDEHMMWNEYKKEYELVFKSNHAHFVIKFKKGKGKTLPELAAAIGVAENYIEKPLRGGHAYDNMLSYLIHIKYDTKYQYDVNEVFTICGKKYIEHYCEHREAWMRGRAEITVRSAKELVNFLKVGIMNGEITKEDIAHNDEWLYAYALNKPQMEKAFEAKNIIFTMRRDYPKI